MSLEKSNDERCVATLTVEPIFIGRHLWFRRRGDGQAGMSVGRGIPGSVGMDGEAVEQTRITSAYWLTLWPRKIADITL